MTRRPLNTNAGGSTAGGGQLADRVAGGGQRKGPRTAGPGWEETYMSKPSVSDSATTIGCKYVTYGTKLGKMYNDRPPSAAAQ